MTHSTKQSSYSRSPLLGDVVIIAISVGTAVFLARSDIVAILISSIQGLAFVGNFIAGLFFTSVFTTAPAIIALGEMTRLQGIVPVAVWGALGAVAGDVIIFHFIRDRFSEHILELVKHRTLWKRLHTLFRLRLFRWFSLFVGLLIIASPLPDELGIGLFGFSKLKSRYFTVLSFLCNFAGIVLIGLAARSL